MDFVNAHDIRLFRPAAYCLCGLVRLRQGRYDEARAGLLRACRDAEELGTPTTLYQALIALSECESSAGAPGSDPTRAAQYRVEAAAVVARLADAMTDEALREAFLSRSEIRPLLERAG
jgi:hypothetical protein